MITVKDSRSLALFIEKNGFRIFNDTEFKLMDCDATVALAEISTDEYEMTVYRGASNRGRIATSLTEVADVIRDTVIQYHRQALPDHAFVSYK